MIADEDIIAICERECGWLAGAKDAELIKFARAIIAATAPNKQLVAALKLAKAILDNQYDDMRQEGKWPISLRLGPQFAQINAALAAAGVEVAK